MNTSGYINYSNAKIHYQRFGDGENTLVCIHGYGEDAGSFYELAKHLGEYTVFAIDLPYHGLTSWPEKQDFLPADLMSIINETIKQPSFALMGYSMGGRLALSLYQQYPTIISALYLLAPDGIHKSRWYWFAATWGNKLFKILMTNPSFFLSIAGAFNTLGLVNKGTYSYVRKSLKQEHQRTAVYKIWTAMRFFKPDLSLIQAAIKKNITPTTLVYGKYDRVIKYKHAQKLRHVPSVAIYVIDTGHRLLQAKNCNQIVHLITQQN